MPNATAILALGIPVPGTSAAASVWSATDAAAATPPMALTNSGRDVTYSGAANWQAIRGSVSKTSGKLYVEFYISTATAGQVFFGLADAGLNVGDAVGASSNSGGVGSFFGTNYVSGAFTGNHGSSSGTPQPGDVWALAVDFTAGSFWIARNNVWDGGVNPATGSSPIISFVPATVGPLFPALSFHANTQGTWTLQTAAANQTYAAPSGFTAWDPVGGTFADMAGNIAPSLAFAGALANLIDLVGDITPQVLLSGDLSFSDLIAGDIAPQVSFGGDLSFSLSLVGDVAPSVTFGGDLTVAASVSSVDLSGDMRPTVTLGGDLTFIRDLAGDVSSSVALAGGISLSADLAGDVAPTVTFSGDLSFSNLALAGNISPQITLTGNMFGDVFMVGAIAPSITFTGALTSGPLWKPTEPCEPVEWEEAELCNG
jgi:hypothetical protein